MAVETQAGTMWPRRRLQVRSMISATLPIGWTWAAMTALIPYFLIGHGSGTSADTVLGATRATWMSLHVWSTIAMGLLTISHVVLNRKGVTRSYRIVSGAPHKLSSTRPAKRGYAWVGAALLIAVTTVGGFWFASVDDTHGSGNGRETSADEVEPATVGSGSFRGQGNGRR
jgi:hypothetical protein